MRMNSRDPSAKLLLPVWAKVGLTAAHLILPVGWFLSVRIGRPRFLGLYLYGVVALLLFDLCLLAVWGSEGDSVSGSDQIASDWRVPLIVTGLSVAVFATLGRGAVAYLLVALTATLLVYRSRVLGEEQFRVTLLLAALLGAVLLSVKAFSVAYLAQTPDTIKHAEISATIVETGSLAVFQATRYEGFLVFHTYTAFVSQIVDVPTRTAAGLLFGAVFPAAAVGVGRLVRRFTDSSVPAGIAVVLFITNSSFLTWGSMAHYQSFSVALFVFLLLAVIATRPPARSTLLMVPIAVVWVSAHHLSIAMAIALLFVPLALVMLDRQTQPLAWNETVVLLGVLIFSKWAIDTTWFSTPIAWLLFQSPVARIGQTGANIGTTLFYVDIYTNPVELFKASLPFFTDHLYMSFLLAALAAGSLALLARRDRKTTLLLAGAAVPAVFYFPNPVWVPLRGFSVLGRWDIIALPFVVGLPAVGLAKLLRHTSLTNDGLTSGIRATFIVIFIFVTMFTSVSAGFYAPTTSDLIGADRHDKQYLDHQDLTVAFWVSDHAGKEKPTYATAKIYKYLEYSNGPAVKDTFDARWARISGINGRFVYPPGLTVVQVQSFRQNSVKVSFTPRKGYYPNETRVSEPVGDTSVTYNRNAANVVYNNGANVIHESTANMSSSAYNY